MHMYNLLVHIITMNTTRVLKNLPCKKESGKVCAKNSNRKRKHSSASYKSCHKENTSNTFTMAMSSWAENFTTALNWQMKHQIAFWKARARTLEYENKFLHEVIKKNFMKNSNEENKAQEQNNDKELLDPEEHLDGEYYEESDECVENDNDEFVVSEELIEFLKENAKFKEDAKRERENFKKEQERVEIVDNSMTEDKLKELYGEKWQRVCASEMSLLTDFMKLKDEHDATYWPNIPFNLS